jgi:hypothetical protein
MLTLLEQEPPAAPSRATGLLLQLATLAAFATWVYPPLLARVGLAGLAGWLTASPFHRFALMPVLLALALLSRSNQVRVRQQRLREAWEPFAQSIGARMVEAPTALEQGVWRGGPTIQAELSGGRVTYEVVREPSQAWTRARVEVAATGGLGFQLSAPGPGDRAVRKAMGPLLGLALSMALPRAAGSREREALARLGFVAGPEISTGIPDLDAVVSLRTGDPGAARRLMAASGLQGALLGLASGARGWDWSLVPAGVPGAGLMEVKLPGVVADTERLRAVHHLLRAALDHFDSEGSQPSLGIAAGGR